MNMWREVSLLVPVAVLCLCGWAWAGLIDADGGDTEYAELDLLDIYVDYNAAGLTITYGHDPGGWTGVQVGVALVTTSTGGGTTDPWAHQIGFTGMCLPDFIAYIDLDSQWNEWCVWNGTDWDRIENILGWTIDGAEDVLVLPWDLLGIDCAEAFAQIFMEMWITQNGSTKGPLDLSYNDDLQLSTTTGTTWDITTPVVISCYHCIDLYAPSGTEASSWGGVKNLWR